MAQKESPVCIWDFTLNGFEGSAKQIGTDLKELAKKWTFQQEEGKTKHWQGRLCLRKKLRLADLKKLSDKTVLKGCHWSKSSTNSGKKFDYCMKLDTRIDGPWKDDTNWDEDIPRQLKRARTLRPWQDTVIKKIKKYETDPDFDDREINVIYSKDGGIGGNILKQFMAWHKIARPIPPFLNAEKLIAFVMSFPPANAYFIDMPRGMSKAKLAELYIAIEQIKDGYVYDPRFKGRDRLFSSPTVWVKTNTIPDEDLLSRDRWKLWHVQGEELTLLPSQDSRQGEIKKQIN